MIITKHQRIRFDKMVDLADVKDTDKILDLGCGDGGLSSFIQNSCDYIGVDKEGGSKYQSEMMEEWNKLKRKTHYIIHDLEKGLPKQLVNKKFDIIFLGEVIEHIENHRTLLKQCMKLLSKDGRIILSTPLAWRVQFKTDCDHIHSFTPLNLRILAEQCKLKIIKMVGSFVCIPFFNIDFNVNWTFYTNNLIVRMEKVNKISEVVIDG